ncbi:diguanylate cyclase domain-containing protein [Phenylobacterium sp.]|jgi:diguanylate cyclase (GGDEF)-like protein|uniref:diguanylate cyclase domain-containing protein n=1 Tax=Phenylobacterium sp. TaxID=1871053 RepID=UPI002F3F7F67
MYDQKTRRGLIWPALLLVAAALGLLIGAQIYLAREADLSAFIRERTVVANGLDNYADDIARRSVSVTLWDDAVVHLDNRFDYAWAETNIGRYLSDTEKFQAAFILDRADRTIYAMRGGLSVPIAGVGDLAAAASDLVAETRVAESRRGPAAAIIARRHAIETPIFASGYRRVGSDAYLITAMLVQPDFGTALPQHERSTVVVSALRIDAAFLGVIADRFLLKDARFQFGAPPAAAGRAELALNNGRNSPIASIAWTPPTPGTELLRRALPSTLLLVGALCALAWALYVRARKAAHNLIASEARAAHMAYHDSLTGLPNRTSLAEKLGREHEQLRRTGVDFAVHCVDLDRFKEINDTFGHAAGDELIRAVAKILSAACRRGDTLARLGGDEFAIVQASATPGSAAALADRIIATLAEPIELSVGRTYIGASIGVTLVRDPLTDPHDHLHQADLALYRAKDGGRGRYAFFEPEMDAAVRMRRALQADLRQALSNRDLQMVYQPQVDASGQAFADSAAWPGLKVAVNLSAAQLRLRDFTTKLAELVAETGVDPRRFEARRTRVAGGRFPLPAVALYAAFQPARSGLRGRTTPMIRRALAVAALTFAAAGSAAAQTPTVIRTFASPTAPIAQTVSVPAGYETIHISGVLPDLPKAPEKPGDAETQAAGVFDKIAAILKTNDLSEGDVVTMTIYMAGGDGGARMDFAGMMKSYLKHYGTAAQPNKPARSTVQVAALAAPGALLEVEVSAVRAPKASPH